MARAGTCERHTTAAQTLGQLQLFKASRTSARMHGRACLLRSLFWANATIECNLGHCARRGRRRGPAEFGLLSVVLHPGLVQTAVGRVA